jgi:hypothetical protein
MQRLLSGKADKDYATCMFELLIKLYSEEELKFECATHRVKLEPLEERLPKLSSELSAVAPSFCSAIFFSQLRRRMRNSRLPRRKLKLFVQSLSLPSNNKQRSHQSL